MRGGDRPGIVRLTCPVAALETWIRFARLARGPLFRRVTGEGKAIGLERLNDQGVARLVKKTALAAACRAIFPSRSEARNFPGIRCAPVSPLPPRSMNAMYKSNLAMPQPR